MQSAVLDRGILSDIIDLQTRRREYVCLDEKND